jgi:hypothetical protein
MMTLYFIPRCSFSPDDTTRELLSRCSPFELVVKGTAWRRVLDAYITSKLLEVPFDSARLQRKALRSLKITAPGELLLYAADFIEVETFNTPLRPARPAQGRHGHRGYQAAVAEVPAQAGPQALRVIQGCPIYHLQEPDNAIEPLGPLATLAGCLGPCSTRS